MLNALDHLSSNAMTATDIPVDAVTLTDKTSEIAHDWLLSRNHDGFTFLHLAVLPRCPPLLDGVRWALQRRPAVLGGKLLL